jgi:hypothetical protein
MTLGHCAALVELQAGSRQHEARIDAVVASGDTATGAGARAGPAGAAACWIAATAQEVQDFGNDCGRLAAVDASGPSGWTDLNALAAPGAAVEDLTYSNIE